LRLVKAWQASIFILKSTSSLKKPTIPENR
jgi:hypothetical protein